MVGPGLRGFVVGLDACRTFVVHAIAVQERQWKTVARQDEGGVGDLLFMGARHGQLFSPRADIGRVDRASITQLRGVVVVADVQMTISVDTHADAVMSVAQVVFTGQVEGFQRVARQVALHQPQGVGVDVEGGVLGVVVGQDAVVAKDDGVDGVARPSVAQVVCGRGRDLESRLFDTGRRLRNDSRR